jgi:hypothetical protein
LKSYWRRLGKKEVLLVVALAIVISIMVLRHASTSVADFVTEYSYSIRIRDSVKGIGNISILAKVSNVGQSDGYPALRLSVSIGRNRGFYYEIPLGLLRMGSQVEYEWNREFVGIDPEYAGVYVYVPNV